MIPNSGILADVVNSNFNQKVRISDMPNKIYVVELSNQERNELNRLINTKKGSHTISLFR